MAFLDNTGVERLWQHIVAKLGDKADKTSLESGDVVVAEATHAVSADTATTAASATEANHAATADSATTATTATNANHATTADSATSATSATKATQDSNGNVITETYQTVANATSQHNALQSAINGKADTSHTHAISDVTNLQSSLDAKVPTSRTINGKELTANITLSASDVGADASGTAATQAAATLESAKEYADGIKDDLLNGAGEAYDTLKELGDLISENVDAIDALETVAAGKADKVHTHAIADVTDLQTTLDTMQGEIDANESSISSHASNKSNPHGVTASQVGAYTKAEVDSALSEKADSTHAHDGYMATANPTGTGSLLLNAKADTTAGYCAVAEGYNNTASGRAAHAEGEGTTASSQATHAEGYNTTASSWYAHAEGYNTIAEGQSAHAEGGYAIASGSQSHAEGWRTIAASTNQHVQGKYNIEDADDTYAHIVGNGTSDARANAHTLDWDGNAWYQGTIKVGGTSYADATEIISVPASTTDDNGKFLRVANGVPAWTTVENAEGVSF